MSSLHNDYLEQQHENLLEEEHNQAQGQAHQHFVAIEFGHIINSIGVQHAISLLDSNAKNKLLNYIEDQESDFDIEKLNNAIRKLNQLNKGV
jgi:hypothetical protein